MVALAARGQGDEVPDQSQGIAMNATEIMSKNLVAVRDDASLLQAVRLMTEHHISGIPVLDASARLVGILTDGDLLRRAELGTDGDKPGPLRTFLHA